MTAPAVKVWQYPFKPYGKQREALTSPADEVLFGGSLGGGKSEVLLAACVTVCTLVPGAKALLVRRSYSELSELVKRLRERLPSEIAKYNKSDHVFYFANGAELHLGYLERPEHATRYQGHEFVLVAFDELTHYDKESYVLLMSRLRATGAVARRMKQLRLPLRTLSASNPGSKGHGWVKSHFIDPAPHHTLFTDEESGARRIFIPSSLYDNPYIDHAEYLKKLGAMDPDLKRAMVDGDWDIISGTRFNQWRTKHHVISPSQLPIPALTGRKVICVDYGFSAPFAAVWLCLLHDGLIVQYREEYATELTARQQAKRILELSSEEEALTGEKIPIVMDPAMWRRNDATAHKSLNKDLPPVGSPAHDYMKVLNRVPHKGVHQRVHGWHQLDEKLLVRDDGLSRFMVYDTCRDTIRTLPAMPRDKKNPEDVLTTAEDHLCFTGDTLIATEHGQTPIRDVRVGDRIWTRAGLRPVTESMMTQRNAPVGRVEFSDGAYLEGTANHPVFTERGVIPLDALRYGDTVQLWTPNQSPSSSTASNSVDTRTLRTRLTDATTSPQGTIGNKGSERSTKRSGSTTTSAESPMDSMFITETMTPRTTSLATLFSWKVVRMLGTTCRNLGEMMRFMQRTLLRSNELLNGIEVKKVGPGTLSTASGHGKAVKLSATPASTAVNGSKLYGGAAPSSAATRASLGGAVPADSMTLLDSVRTAVGTSPATSTTRPVLAHGHVVSSFAQTVSADVYNLTVEGEHEYFANGVLVHNCDAIRYGLMFLAGKRVGQKQEERERSKLSPITGGMRSQEF